MYHKKCKVFDGHSQFSQWKSAIQSMEIYNSVDGNSQFSVNGNSQFTVNGNSQFSQSKSTIRSMEFHNSDNGNSQFSQWKFTIKSMEIHNSVDGSSQFSQWIFTIQSMEIHNLVDGSLYCHINNYVNSALKILVQTAVDKIWKIKSNRLDIHLLILQYMKKT